MAYGCKGTGHLWYVADCDPYCIVKFLSIYSMVRVVLQPKMVVWYRTLAWVMWRSHVGGRGDACHGACTHKCEWHPHPSVGGEEARVIMLAHIGGEEAHVQLCWLMSVRRRCTHAVMWVEKEGAHPQPHVGGEEAHV